MIASLLGPIAYFLMGAGLIAVGAARWFGWSTSWYVAPGARERRLQRILGRSPIPFVFLGLPFLFADGAVVAILLDARLSAVFAVAIVISALIAVILIVARPRWGLPSWARASTESGRLSR